MKCEMRSAARDKSLRGFVRISGISTDIYVADVSVRVGYVGALQHVAPVLGKNMVL